MDVRFGVTAPLYLHVKPEAVEIRKGTKHPDLWDTYPSVVVNRGLGFQTWLGSGIKLLRKKKNTEEKTKQKDNNK